MVNFGDTLLRNAHPGWRYVDYEGLKQLIDEPRRFRSALTREISAVDLSFECLLRKFEESLPLRRRPVPTGAEPLEGDPDVTASALRTYAVVNYLAVLKICKKFDKEQSKPAPPLPPSPEPLRYGVVRRNNSFERREPLPSETITAAVERELAATSFCLALRSSDLLLRPEEGPGKGTVGQGRDGECASCPVCLEDLPAHPAVLPCSHRFCWACLADCSARGIRTCPLCRSEQSLEPVEIEIQSLIGSLVHGGKYFPANRLQSNRALADVHGCDGRCESPSPPVSEAGSSSAASSPHPHRHAASRELVVLTWNVCAVAFPFAAPHWQLFLGALVGQSWHDVARDASLMPLSPSGVPRLAQQADYILSSGAGAREPPPSPTHAHLTCPRRASRPLSHRRPATERQPTPPPTPPPPSSPCPAQTSCCCRRYARCNSSTRSSRASAAGTRRTTPRHGPSPPRCCCGPSSSWPSPRSASPCSSRYYTSSSRRGS